MKNYGSEEVNKRISDAMKTIEDCVRQSLQENPFARDTKLPEIYCLNCGRSVYVGRCCPSPNITNMERPDPEIMKAASKYADDTVIRGFGETYPAYFLRKVKARREKAEELAGNRVSE
ncbi:hypothetical protein PHYNN_192 [Pantoea phage Phynn]|nr:hypothetical protein PHYNN_192 [Pantoea phage Phynn]